jgi:hypothetical protein
LATKAVISTPSRWIKGVRHALPLRRRDSIDRLGGGDDRDMLVATERQQVFLVSRDDEVSVSGQRTGQRMIGNAVAASESSKRKGSERGQVLPFASSRHQRYAVPQTKDKIRPRGFSATISIHSKKQDLTP